MKTGTKAEKRYDEKLGLQEINFDSVDELEMNVRLCLEGFKGFIYRNYPWRPIAQSLEVNFGFCDGRYIALLPFKTVKRRKDAQKFKYLDSPGELRRQVHDSIEEMIARFKELCGYLPELVELADKG